MEVNLEVKMEKQFCDECEKEIKEFGSSLFGSKWYLYGFFYNFYNFDFCSLECLKKFIDNYARHKSSKEEEVAVEV